jgi:hypothetical protein
MKDNGAEVMLDNGGSNSTAKVKDKGQKSISN